MIVFKRKDFRNLATIKNINKSHYHKNYDDEKYKEQAKKLVKEVKPNIKTIENYIASILGTKFECGSSYIIKDGGGNQDGMYRPNLWVWITNKNLYLKIKKKIPNNRPPAQIFMPQLQVSISPEGLAVGEIWMEPVALKHYWEDFVKIIKKSKITNDKRVKLYLVYKDKNIDGKEFDISQINLVESLIRNGEIKKAGIYYRFKINEVINKDISNIIIKYTNKIIKDIYNPLIGEQKDVIVDDNYLKPEHKRKPAKKIDLKEYVRKGSKPVKVSKKHEKIKAKLLRKLKNQFPKSAFEVDSEKNFVDITVEGKNFIYLYEIKTKEKPVRCIRDAIGQLLYYLWANGNPKKKEIKLFVVGENEIALEADSFYHFIKKKINVEIEYQTYK